VSEHIGVNAVVDDVVDVVTLGDAADAIVVVVGVVYVAVWPPAVPTANQFLSVWETTPLDADGLKFCGFESVDVSPATYFFAVVCSGFLFRKSSVSSSVCSTGWTSSSLDAVDDRMIKITITTATTTPIPNATHFIFPPLEDSIFARFINIKYFPYLDEFDS
jgi:hypothetical protein